MTTNPDRPATPRDWSSQPPYRHPPYRSTLLRGPGLPPVPLVGPVTEAARPIPGAVAVGALDHDLTRNACVNGEPLGERVVVTGRVTDDAGRPLPDTLIEIWQANAAGRYVHKADQHDAPLDPNFLGAGRCVTDADGRYRFISIRPGAYPWGNHHNAWRPSHIHLSLLGPSFVQRLVTQMYFPGDPLLAFDPIYQGVPEAAQPRMVAGFALAVTEPGQALGYVFDIVLRGPAASVFEPEET